LDFLITRPVRGTIVDSGGILVNVPDPARFALHKFIISGERVTVMHTKREKDLHQASQVFSVLIEERPGDARLAWEEVQHIGKRWVKRVKDGVSALKKIDSVVAEKIASFLTNTR
jgi:hypothetical protein